MIKQNIPDFNGYQFWRDEGNEYTYNLYAIKDNEGHYVCIFRSDGEKGFKDKLERLKGYAKGK